MIERDAFELIDPNDRYNPFIKTPLDVFLKNVKVFLPNFPDDVIEQWAYEAFCDFCSGPLWEVYERLQFKETVMSVDELLYVKDPDQFYENDIGPKVTDCPPLPELVKYMNIHMTWPRPIIVLDTIHCVKDESSNLLFPYQLLEGHIRLAYLHRMVDANMAVLPLHKVWLATLE